MDRDATSTHDAPTAWRWIAAVAALLLTATLFTPAAAEASQGNGATARYLVTTDPGDPASERDLRARGAEDVRGLQYTPDTVVVVASPQAAEGIARARGVTNVEPDAVMQIQHHRPDHCGGPVDQQPDHCNDDGDDPEPDPEPEPDPDPEPDPEPGEQTTPWGVTKIDAPAAWGTSTGAGATVCVADTGIDKTHEDLDYLAGRNFHTSHPRGRNLDPSAYGDGHGHGTHVAGTVAALDNDRGVVGVAPGADLLVAKVLGDNGSGSISQIAEGLNWCADQGADVINMSFAGSRSDTLEATTSDLADAGVVLVAASGNSGNTSLSSPAVYDGVIAVGATDEDDAIAGFSNRGEDLNAPGVAVGSTLPGDAYGTMTGTSMASPHVAGVAALLLASGTHHADVGATLTGTAHTIHDGLRVDAAAAVTD